METEKFVEAIPEWAMCYIVNGDPTGLEDEDIQLVDKFTEENSVLFINPLDGNNKDGDVESYFSKYPAFGLPTTVIDCIVCCKN